MFCPTSIIGLRFGKEGLYCLLYEQPKNKNTYPLCKKHTHYIMPRYEKEKNIIITENYTFINLNGVFAIKLAYCRDICNFCPGYIASLNDYSLELIL